jgi:hypothetical protein
MEYTALRTPVCNTLTAACNTLTADAHKPSVPSACLRRVAAAAAAAAAVGLCLAASRCGTSPRCTSH